MVGLDQKNNEFIRSSFPILKQKIYTKNLVYFDNAATTQKPQKVIDTIIKYYTEQNANTHSVHFLANELTKRIEEVRSQVASFIGSHSYEVIFTKSATEGINLVAQTVGEILPKKSEIATSISEHHANFLPWQRLTQNNNFELKIINLNANLEIDLVDLSNKITENTALLAITAGSNILGKMNPIEKIIQIAKKINPNILVLVDAAQTIAHKPMDVKELNCDFLVFSGHKMYAPLGSGVLYVKKEIADKLNPYQVGGDMVDTVTINKSSFAKSPHRFEAGTLNFEAILGLGSAIEFINEFRQQGLAHYENSLTDYLYQKLSQIPGIKILSDEKDKLPIISFFHPDINSLDLATFLNFQGIACRSGQMCSQILLDYLSVDSILRFSLAIYNTIEEIDFATQKLTQAIDMLKPNTN